MHGRTLSYHMRVRVVVVDDVSEAAGRAGCRLSEARLTIICAVSES